MPVQPPAPVPRRADDARLDGGDVEARGRDVGLQAQRRAIDPARPARGEGRERVAARVPSSVAFRLRCWP